MFEAEKTAQVREHEFSKNYLSGRVLDIGCGNDLVVPNAEPFDMAQGDANYILQYHSPETFDCVHSSHALEHMFDPVQCLADWWTLVKPGGYLITVVPEEDLYEQGVWPSRFNGDHKVTFTLNRQSTWSPVSLDLYTLVSNLPNSKILNARVQSQGYQKKFLRLGQESDTQRQLRNKCIQIHANAAKKGLFHPEMAMIVNEAFGELGAPIDQTLGLALAQIEVVAQKRGENG